MMDFTEATSPPHTLPLEQIFAIEANGHLGDGLPSPADILPDDVLAYLFSITSTSFDDDRRVREKTTRAASQVCMRWRSIALSYPQIWSSNIDYSRHSLLWIQELLRRSDPVVIDFGSRISCIGLSGRKGDGLGMLELVLKCVSRIRVFHFAARPSIWELLCSDFLRHPAPKLEFFSLSIVREQGSMYTDTLFSNHAPRLQTFHVNRCAIDFRSPVLSQLTDLHVAEVNFLPNVSTVFCWLELLRQMPSLRWLTLIHAISGGTPDVAHPTIELDHLKRLSINGLFQETVMLITHILAPPLFCLRLRCTDVQFGSSQRLLWTFVEKMINCWETDVPDRRLLAYSCQDCFAIGNFIDLGGEWHTDEEMIYSNRPKPTDPILTLEMWTQQAEMVNPLLFSLLALFKPTLPTTTSLELWLDYHLNDAAQVFLPIFEYFRLLTRLETLNVGVDLHTHLFPLLEQHSGPGSDSIIFPKLRRLRFLQTYFRPDSNSGSIARAYVEWRRRLGFPIEQIGIYGNRVDLTYVHSLFPGIEVDTATEWNDFQSDVESDFQSDVESDFESDFESDTDEE